jgi:tetratricopeptide (TPR) repeat protein
MRNKTILFSLVVAVWLAAGQPALPAEIASVSESALTLTLSQRARGLVELTLPQKERGPVELVVPENRLEERLFADAADGRLTEFSPFEAALVAGGVEDTDTLHRYQQTAAALVEQLRHSTALDGTPAEQAEAIFEFMHRQVLYGGYDLAYTDLRRVLDEGRFNCVSATVLFNYLAGELGLECRGLEMPGHAMTRVTLPGGTLDIETTCPRWFRLMGDPKRQEAAVKMIGNSLPADHAKAREVSPIQLAAMIYYNRGVDLLAEKRFAEAAKVNAKALRLDPQNATARGNLLATINNWSIELGSSQHFAEAVDLLRQGLALDAKFTAFAQNYVHVHHQWADHLCQTGHFEEALDILSRAAAEMPDRDYLRRAQDEVCERWAQAADTPQSEPLLEMPCLMSTPPVQ